MRSRTLRWLAAGVIVLASSGWAVAQTEADAVVDLLRADTNMRQIIERSLKIPGDDWRAHVNVERRRLEALLHSNGYLNGKLIVDLPARLDGDQTVTMRVEQGERYRIGTVEITGGDGAGAPLDQIDAKLGDIANTDNAKSIGDQALWALGEAGYPFAKVGTTQIRPHGEPAHALVRLTIDAGKLAVFQGLEIDGHGGESVRALLPFREGQIFSNSTLAEFRREVSELSDVRSARIDVEPGVDNGFVLRARIQRPLPPLELGTAGIVGILLLLGTLVVLSQRRVMLAGATFAPKLNLISAGVSSLLLASGMVVLGRALSFL